MKIKVLSRREMEEFKSDENHIVISISDPNSEKVKIISKPIDILSLQFHDVDKRLIKTENCDLCEGTGYLPIYKNINGGHCYRCTDKIDVKLFTNTDALNIFDFVEIYKKDIDLIAINCEMGISRSAGIAGALSLIYNKLDEYYFKHYIPNMLVYRKILNVYMKNKKEKYHV